MMIPEEIGNDLAILESKMTRTELAERISGAIRAAVEAERRACANVASRQAVSIITGETILGTGEELDTAVRIAAAIRRRGKTEKTA